MALPAAGTDTLHFATTDADARQFVVVQWAATENWAGGGSDPPRVQVHAGVIARVFSKPALQPDVYGLQP